MLHAWGLRLYLRVGVARMPVAFDRLQSAVRDDLRRTLAERGRATGRNPARCSANQTRANGSQFRLLFNRRSRPSQLTIPIAPARHAFALRGSQKKYILGRARKVSSAGAKRYKHTVTCQIGLKGGRCLSKRVGWPDYHKLRLV